MIILNYYSDFAQNWLAKKIKKPSRFRNGFFKIN